MALNFTIDAKGRSIIDKDPQATLDYTFDWTDYLAALPDTISSAANSATFTIDTLSGITIAAQSNTSTKATVWIAGGINGATAMVTSTIKTAGGRTDERSIYIKLKDL